jgi:uncharacterized protein
VDASLTIANLTHPAVLAFCLGLVAVVVRSDLRIPPQAAKLLSSYLLLAIGLKGGAALAVSSLGEVAMPALATIALGVTIPVGVFALLHRWARFSVADAAAIAAHYGSVSAVTFAAAVLFATAAGSTPEGFMPALVAILEVPGILVALAIARRARPGTRISESIHEVLTGSSMLLLLGGMTIGWVSGPSGLESVAPVFVAPFAGVLVLFLLHLGTVAGERLHEVRKVGPVLVGFAVLAPLPLGMAGVVAGNLAGLSVGGAAVLGAMTASASYIAAPAAVQVSLPEANLAFALTAALVITFPVNLLVGIPLFHAAASLVGG